MQVRYWHIFFFSFFALCSEVCGQSTQTITYTTREGLPSNNIYLTRIDSKGFLWVATDNGLARFDGKRFKVFTTTQGLTDNEIVDLFIDSSDRLWAIPFLHSPCYFNEEKQQFENPDTDPELRKIVLGNSSSATVLRFGGVFFGNTFSTATVFKEGKVKGYADKPIGYRKGFRKVMEYAAGQYLLFTDNVIYRLENDQITHTYLLKKKLTGVIPLQDRVAVLADRDLLIVKPNHKGEPDTLHQKTLSFPVTIFSFTNRHLIVVSDAGSKYLIDTATLNIVDEIITDKNLRSVTEDNNGNTWISSTNNGLIKIQPKSIRTFFPEALSGVFNTLLRTDKYLIAGNNTGDIISYDGLFRVNKVKLTEPGRIDGVVRKILRLPNHIFVSCQARSVLMNTTASKIIRTFELQKNWSSKMAAIINDSTICLGSHAAVYKYNYLTNTIKDSAKKRVSALCISRKGEVYIGSTDGIYKWTNAGLQAFGKDNKALSYRTNTIVESPDGLIWVGLGTDTLVVLKDDKPIAFIPLGRKLAGTMCKALYSDTAGQIWLGTNKGLNKISYQLDDNTIRYSSTIFGVQDGLPGEQVNDITSFNDTLYVATQGGVCYLPENLVINTNDISCFITGITVNGQGRPLAGSYSLEYDENNIKIDFSGVDLSGFIPHFEYSINDGAWLPTEGIELSSLSPGNYTIRIRAVNRDSSPSKRIAEVKFYIRKPFWKNDFLWFLVALVALGGILYFLQMRDRNKQKQVLARSETEKKLAQLEMQALMAQINPHFVFNCLNSIKGLMYDKEYRQADVYLDKFADLLRNTMDNAEASVISLAKEIHYLDTYLQLEKLRFDDAFSYAITADPAIDADHCFVPAMLLQPYVENAIRHGVRHLSGRKGNIAITVVTKDTQLVFTIDDDGVGRAKAAQYRSARHIEYQSRGMLLSKRRAELYDIEQAVIDKTDEAGNSTGTTIILKIPLSLQP
jgi:ligand-binding sensor domain-containing protein/two-component sensor histidine kinase